MGNTGDLLALAGPVPSLVGSRLFIPLSIGNHYYSNKRLKRVINEIAIQSSYSCFFVCDELRRVSYYAKGATDVAIVSNKVQIQLQQAKQTLHKCGLPQLGNAVIWSWSDLPRQNTYSIIYSKTLSLLTEDSKIKEEIVRQAQTFMPPLRHEQSVVNRVLIYQTQYFALETALSIYMNEIIGFDYEVYRRSMGFIDYIYDTHSDFVQALSGKKPVRKVLGLENFWNEA